MSDESAVANETGATATETPVRAPLSAEEYERRLQAQGRDLREQRAQIRQLTAAMESKGAEPQTRAEKAAEPDIDADPIAWMRYAKGRLEGFDQERTQQEAQERQSQQQVAAISAIASQMSDYERDFRSDNPDYDKAAAHYRNARAEELLEEGTPQGNINEALRMELINVVARAIRGGKDPADVVYKLAKKRGFGVDGSEKKLQTLEKAQAAGKSLSGSGGRSGDGEITIEYVNSLSGKEFTEARMKLRAQERKRRA
jgi:hypothetical protein